MCVPEVECNEPGPGTRMKRRSMLRKIIPRIFPKHMTSGEILREVARSAGAEEVRSIFEEEEVHESKNDEGLNRSEVPLVC